MPHINFSQKRQDDDDGADQRRQTDIEVESEADREIERHPRQIEQCDGPDARQKSPDRIQIAQRLNSIALVPGDKRDIHQCAVNALADRLIEIMSNPHKNTAADNVQYAERSI